MTDQTNKAAAALLYKTAIQTLRNCRGNDKVTRSPGALAQCATPQLVDLVMANDTLMHALVLHYAMRVVGDLPPAAKPKPEPKKVEDWSINLLAPQPEK